MRRLNILLLLLSTNIVFAQTKTINLVEGRDLSQQINKSNTTYIIIGNYNLRGKILIIPDGCTLYFNGGSIENGTVYFANTNLQGYPQIFCNLKGNVPMADITWFGARRGDKTSDVGKVINQVQRITNHIVIPAGEYYQTNEEIRIEGNKYIDWTGTIICTCSKKNFDAVTIAAGVVSLDMTGSLICQSKSVTYEKGKETNICGMTIENVNNGSLRIGTITGFNTGMKVFGYGGGCSYNQFSIQSIRDCNTSILITQRDKNGKIGWANENTFYGGRFWVSSSWNIDKRETHAIVAKGIYADDSYNKVNSLYFLRPCAEGAFVPFVFNNAEIVTVVDCRTERGVVGAKLSGKSNRISMSNSFGTSLSNLDLDDLERGQSRPLFLEQMKEGGNSTVELEAGSTGELSVEIVFDKGLSSIERQINVQLVGNDSGNRKYVILVPKEVFSGKVDIQSDVLFAQSLYYNKNSRYWVSGADINSTQIVVGENIKKAVLKFRAVKGVVINLPNGARIVNVTK